MDADIIYRIENEKGRGFYCCGVAREIEHQLKVSLNTAINHPRPSEDSLLVKNCPENFFIPSIFHGKSFDAREYVFGFSSIQQFKSWVYSNAMLEIMELHGCKLLKMKGKVYHGNTQAIIEQDTAELLEVIELYTLLD